MTSLIHHGPVAVRGTASSGLDGEREPLPGRVCDGSARDRDRSDPEKSFGQRRLAWRYVRTVTADA
jgi:hypothetical protein